VELFDHKMSENSNIFLTIGRGFVSFISLGIPFLLSVTGAFGIQQAKDYGELGFQMVFMGIYMIVFAAILFTFEVLQLVKIPYLNEEYRKNFGFMYGPTGRGLYTLL